ncbi:MAG: nicotinate (nicotinamide) nucleotide adenylyltransferase [candidate division WOR-3 bacterium]|nr:nicotinate (nicotinamide) nucleotide adenylyltransferase [candidate division WOR-3 bacterium]
MKGVFGGNFDPVHIGHLILAMDAIRLLELEKVLFIPAFKSPFKKDFTSTPFEHRYKMLELATQDKSFFQVLDIEGKRKGISYTYDTLKELKQKGEELCLLIGEDQAVEFHRWYRWKEILKMVDVFVLRRKKGPKKYHEGLKDLKSRTIEISSAEIRDSIRMGKPVDFLLLDKVLKYIRKHNLYKE